MKSNELPNTIFLHLHGDSDVDNIEDATWTEDRIYPTDVEYVRKKSPWISVEERLPDKGQRVLVVFLYYYKYADREAESRKYIDVFTYENGIWTNDSGISYLGKNVEKGDIKVICWMPIPSFNEILESNRDVLERIKEKGD